MWNCWRGDKAPAKSPDDFNPYAEKKKRTGTADGRVPLKMYRAAFVGE